MVARMFRSTRSLGLLALSVVLVCLAVAPSLAPSPAEGQPRNSAQIYIVQGRVPKSLPGADGIVRFGKKNHRNTLQETSGPIRDRSWLAKLIVKFAKPIGDWEYDILYFEVNGSRREHVGSVVTVHVSDRNETTFVQKVELKRPDFKPKTKMELILRVRGREVGARRFNLAGEEIRIRHTGTVDFTE
jgi:hypothetical protein